MTQRRYEEGNKKAKDIFLSNYDTILLITKICPHLFRFSNLKSISSESLIIVIPSFLK